MYLDGVDKIEKVALQSNFCIFEVSSLTDQAGIFAKSMHIRREKDEPGITIDAIRELQSLTSTKQQADIVIVFEEAELINLNAANAFLKQLEEPSDYIHYVFLTTKLNAILPTIKSRAFCYKIRQEPFNKDKIDIKLRAKVKEFITAKPADLPKLADTYAKDKTSGRNKALELCEATAELCLNTFLETGNKLFLGKAQKATVAYEALKANGNIRVQLIACML